MVTGHHWGSRYGSRENRESKNDNLCLYEGEKTSDSKNCKALNCKALKSLPYNHTDHHIATPQLNIATPHLI